MVQADTGQSPDSEHETGTVSSAQKQVVVQFLQAASIIAGATNNQEEEVVCWELVRDRMQDLIKDYRIIKKNDESE